MCNWKIESTCENPLSMDPEGCQPARHQPFKVVTDPRKKLGTHSLKVITNILISHIGPNGKISGNEWSER